jgi:hypothetical protein
MTNSFKNSFPYVENVEKIKSDGIIKNAVLNDIEAIQNVSVNGENPQILTYEFDSNGQKTQSRFTVFDPEKTSNLKKGDIIPIKHLNGKSITTELEQYSFTMVIPYYVAVIILLVGLIFCLLLYLKIRKEIRLYKTGIIKNAKVISTSHNLGYTFTKFGSSMDVHYEYGNNVAKSRTTNFALAYNKSIGDSIKILVSQDGNSSCLYPELIAKTNGWKENYVA